MNEHDTSPSESTTAAAEDRQDSAPKRSFFTRERLDALNDEKKQLRKAVYAAAREFEALTRPDLDTEESEWQREGPQQPWYPFHENYVYAIDEQGGSFGFIGAYAYYPEHIRLNERGGRSEFLMPTEYFFDPDGWAERYRAECAAYRAERDARQQREQEEWRVAQEERDRETYARLREKFEGSEA